MTYAEMVDQLIQVVKENDLATVRESTAHLDRQIRYELRWRGKSELLEQYNLEALPNAIDPYDDRNRRVIEAAYNAFCK